MRRSGSDFRRILLSSTCLALALIADAKAGQPGLNLTITSGRGTFSTPKPNTTVFTQTSPKASLSGAFSLPAGTSLIIQDPSSADITLIQSTGPRASSINGVLTSNGQLWITNPNGVFFGIKSTIDVGGLIATTHGMSLQNFVAGNYIFDQPGGANARIVNKGTITAADEGSVVLAGAVVKNDGLITAKLGKVELASGNAFAVDFNGDKLLSFAVTAPLTATPTGKQGNPVSALVSNSGTITADGGQVVMTAQAARSVVDNVINLGGLVEATSAHMENGEVVLDAGVNGTANVSGTINVSGTATGESGGAVAITGGTVALQASANIDATGDAGGGTVAIGGNLHGAGPLANADWTTVASGAAINASALTSGNGGTVSIWANQATVFNGAIKARGGAEGGNGGMVETSGREWLSASAGTVDALAPAGKAGTWLLDPATITVVASGGTATLAGVSCYTTCDPGANDTINASLIDAAAANLVLQATGTITVNAAISMANNGIGIEMDAGGNISVNAGITTKGGGAIVFNNPLVPPPGGFTGTINLGANLTTGGGAVTLSGPSVLTANVAIDTTNGGAAPAGGGITFGSTVGGNVFNSRNLTLNAGTAGNVAFQGDVGSTTAALLRLANITINGANNVTSTGANGIYAHTFTDTNQGNFTINGQISTGGVSTTVVGSPSVNGGTVSITAGGALSIGQSLALPDPTTGAYLSSIYTSGADAGSSGNTLGLGVGTVLGSAGSISVTAASIDLFNAATARGGRTDQTGVTGTNNAAPITLNATSGAVIAGGNRGVFLEAEGGVAIDLATPSAAGNGGNGAAISVQGKSVTVDTVLAVGGDSTNPTATVGTAGSITLTATAGNVTLYGINETTFEASLGARSGDAGATATGHGGQLTTTATGTLPNAGGNITVSGSDIVLNTSTNGTNPGSTTATSAAGATSGVVRFSGNIDATTAGTESLLLRVKGGTTVSGNVGAAVPLGAISIITSGSSNFNGGSAIFKGSVKVGSDFSAPLTAGSLEVDGLLTAQTFEAPAGTATLNLGGGASIATGVNFASTGQSTFVGNFGFGGNVSFAGPLTLAGGIATAGGTLQFNGPVVLSGVNSSLNTTFGGADPAGAAVTFASTLDGTTAASNNLTITAGTSGDVSFDARVGRDNFGNGTQLGNVIVSSAHSVVVNVPGAVTTDAFNAASLVILGGAPLNVTGTNSLTLDGNIFTASGAITFGAPVLLGSPLSLDTTDSGLNPAGAAITFASTLDDTSVQRDGLTISAGTGGDVTFAGRVGFDPNSNVGTRPGAVDIVSARNVVMTMPMASAGFSVASLTVAGAGGTTPGAASFTSSSYINTTQGLSTNVNGGPVDIVTSGSVSIGGYISTIGGANGTIGGNGGAVTINAGGSVSVGTGLTLTTNGQTGGSLFATVSSIRTFGNDTDPSFPTQNAGNAGNVSITGASIFLPYGLNANGGDALTTGTAVNGGNAGVVTLAATQTTGSAPNIGQTGNVTIGIPTGPNATGQVSALAVKGGDSDLGNGGNSGSVSISGTTIAFERIGGHGGGTVASSGKTPGHGPSITLLATATTGPAITIYGSSVAASDLTRPLPTQLGAPGGTIGDSSPGAFDGTITGAGGNITIEGTAAGGSLQGTSFLALATGTGTLNGASLNGGPTVEMSAQGGPGLGGTIIINGPIQATTAGANAENLHIFDLNGTANFAGSVGTTVPLGSLAIADANQATFQGAVTAATITDAATSGSLVFNRTVTTPSLTLTNTIAGLTLNGGGTFPATFSIAGTPLTLGGTFQFASNVVFSGPVTLDGNLVTAGDSITFDAPVVLGAPFVSLDTTNSGAAPAGAAITFASTLGGSSFETQALTLTAGTGGNILFQGDVGFASGTRPASITISDANNVTSTASDGIFTHGFTEISQGNLSIAGSLVTGGITTSVSGSSAGNAGTINISTGGNVSIDGDIFAGGGVNTATNVGGNGASVRINAVGSVSIGTGLTLATNGLTGFALRSTVASVVAGGFDPTSAAQSAGNGAAIVIAGSSIDLPFGAVSHGGLDNVAGSAANGGAGASITLSAAQNASPAPNVGDPGNVTIGIPSGPNATGNVIGLFSEGGGSVGGIGGSGGAVTISGTTLIVPRVVTVGGSTEAAANGANGGAITLTATATSGPAVVLYGSSVSPTNASGVATTGTLTASGGRFGDSSTTVEDGTIAGRGGNITVEGATSGALQGSSFVELATSTGTLNGASLNGGSTVVLSAGGGVAGGLGQGGTILINGPIQATTANIESLHLYAGDGAAMTNGPVGTVTPLNTLAFGGGGALPSNAVGSSITFQAPVTVGTEIIDLSTQTGLGTLTFNGTVTTPNLTLTTARAGLVLDGGAIFSGKLKFSGTPVTLGGVFTFTSTFTDPVDSSPFTLAAATTLDVSALSSPVSIAASIDGTTAGGQSLTVIAGANPVTIAATAPLGGTTPLGAVTFSGTGGLTLGGNSITTAGGAINFGGPVALSGLVASLDTTEGGADPAGATVTFASTLDGTTPRNNGLQIHAGTGGDVVFAGRVGLEDLANVGVQLGNVAINSARDVDMTVPFGTNGDGFNAASFAIDNARSLTANSFINLEGGGGNGNGGSLAVTTSGAISIGAGIPLASGLPGIDATGFDAVTPGAVAGNGGAIVMNSGSTISLPMGASSAGSNNTTTTAPAGSGGNAGAITLFATGAVTIGSLATGPEIGLNANGGSTSIPVAGSNGGDGGQVFVSGTTLQISGIHAAGGSSVGASTNGGHGGNITLIATAASGAAVTLDGTVTGPTDAGEGFHTLAADGGRTNGAITGAAGNITIEGSNGGGTLQGFIQLATSTAPALNGGSTVFIFDAGTLAGGGLVDLNGAVQATTSDVENLRIDVSNGTALLGAVGTATPLNSLVLGFTPDVTGPFLPAGSNKGAISFSGPVTVANQFIDLRDSGSLTFGPNAPLTAPSFTPPTRVAAITLGDGATIGSSVNFTNVGGLSLSGTMQFGGDVSIAGPVTLLGNTTIDPGNVTLSGPVNATTAGGQSLDLEAGTGTVTITGPLGTNVPFSTVTMNGGAINIGAPVDATGSITATATGDVTLQSGARLAGDGVTLATGAAFVNLEGSDALTATNGGRWLVYSQNPANDAVDGLAFNFLQYNAPFPTPPTPASGNGFLYTLSPVLTVSLTGTAAKTYDGTTTATLTPANYTLSGAVAGDTIVLNDPTSGILASKNAGTGIGVTASGLAVTSATNGSASIFGYTLGSTSAAGNIGVVNPATLTYVANPASITVGGAVPALSGTVSGFVNGETPGTATTGALAFTTTATSTSPAGNYPITGLGLTANFGNYVFAQAPANATAFTINPAAGTETVAGTLFSDRGVTLLPNATVGLLVNGTSEGTTTASANGVYDFVLPNGTIPSSGAGLLVFLTGGAVKGNTFFDHASGSVSGVDVYGGYLRIVSGQGTLSGANSALAAALGANVGSNFLFTVSAGNALNLTSGTHLDIASTAGALTLDSALNLGAGNLVIESRGSVTQTAPISAGGLALLGTGPGGDYTLNAANSFATLAANTDSVSINDQSALTIGTVAGIAGIQAFSGTFVSTSGNLTLQSDVSSSAVTLATGGAFTNLAGANAITATDGGRWLVYSQNPANDTTGGLAPNFIQYNAPEGTKPVVTGNGFLYTLAPVLTVDLTGTATKTYDATTTATLSAANYAATGVVGGDTVVLNDPTNGTYASANAGSGIGVTASGLAIVSATNGSASVFGYGLSGTTASGNIGVIDQRPVVLTGSRTYDGTTGAAASTLSVTNNLDGGSLTLSGSGILASKNVGVETFAGAGSLALVGNAAGNYTLANIGSNASAVAITPAALTLTAASNTRTYDGTTTAAAIPTIAGLQSGDRITGLGESYADKNAGNGKTLTVNAGFSVNDGNGGNNYTVSTVAAAIGVITPAPLTITAASNTRTYDGTTSAAAIPTIAGLQSGDSVTALSESYADKNAGNGKTLTVNAAFSVNDGNGGNNYTVVTVAAATGTITPAALTVTAASNTRTYDGTTSAAATPTTAGLQSGDSVTGLSESYADKNAGNGKTLTVNAGFSVNDGNGGNNYTVATVAAATGTITPAPLTVTAATDSKTYDGTTVSLPTPTVSGTLFGGDTVTGLAQAFASKNVLGAGGSTLAVSGFTVNDGNSGKNYAVTSATAPGTITPAALTVASVTDSKTYDGTTLSLQMPIVSGTLFGSDTITGLAQAFTSKNVLGAGGSTLAVSSFTVNDGNAGRNYAVSASGTAAGTISPAALTLTAASNTKTYDGTTSAAAIPTIAGLQSGDSVTGLAESYADKNAGNGKTLTVNAGFSVNDGNGGGNYTVSTVAAASGVINPAILTYVADPASMLPGSLVPNLSGSVTGFVGGESLGSATTGTLLFSTFATPASGVGRYPIDGSGLVANLGNYTFVQAPGNAVALSIAATPTANAPAQGSPQSQAAVASVVVSTIASLASTTAANVTAPAAVAPETASSNNAASSGTGTAGAATVSAEATPDIVSDQLASLLNAITPTAGGTQAASSSMGPLETIATAPVPNSPSPSASANQSSVTGASVSGASTPGGLVTGTGAASATQPNSTGPASASSQSTQENPTSNQVGTGAAPSSPSGSPSASTNQSSMTSESAPGVSTSSPAGLETGTAPAAQSNSTGPSSAPSQSAQAGATSDQVGTGASTSSPAPSTVTTSAVSQDSTSSHSTQPTPAGAPLSAGATLTTAPRIAGTGGSPSFTVIPEAGQETDDLATAIALSLGAAPGEAKSNASQPSSAKTVTIIGGLLYEAPLAAPERMSPSWRLPADRNYPNWANDSFWQ